MKLPSTSTLLWTLLAITVTAQSNYTCVGVPCLNFTQKLNHDKPDDLTTFQQRYQLDTSHFKPGGPILFHQSEELPLSSTPISHHVFSDYASKLGGIAVALEHRYFGTSYPSGLSVTSNITAAQYAPLTLDNIFEDSVAFLKWVKETVPGAENSPVIYGGGKFSSLRAITLGMVTDLHV